METRKVMRKKGIFTYTYNITKMFESLGNFHQGKFYSNLLKDKNNLQLEREREMKLRVKVRMWKQCNKKTKDKSHENLKQML